MSDDVSGVFSQLRSVDVLRSPIRRERSDEEIFLPRTLYGPYPELYEKRLPRPYRGWAAFGYHPDEGAELLPVVADVFSRRPEFEDSDEPDEDNARELSRRFNKEERPAYAYFPVAADPRPCPYGEGAQLTCSAARSVDHWSGPDDRLYLTATEQSSSRLGPDKLDCCVCGHGYRNSERAHSSSNRDNSSISVRHQADP